MNTKITQKAWKVINGLAFDQKSKACHQLYLSQQLETQSPINNP